MDENFIMILPSDSCMDTYPTNTVQRFTISVPTRLSFNENWAVALQSVIYPKSALPNNQSAIAPLSAADDLNVQAGTVFSPTNTTLPANLYSAGDHMWIYSDCVEPLLVGDHYHSVLSICPHLPSGIYMPVNLLYVPVRQSDRQSISVWCANHLGQPYPFDRSGRLILILHFKKTR